MLSEETLSTSTSSNSTSPSSLLGSVPFAISESLSRRMESVLAFGSEIPPPSSSCILEGKNWLPEGASSICEVPGLSRLEMTRIFCANERRRPTLLSSVSNLEDAICTSDLRMWFSSLSFLFSATWLRRWI